MVKAVALWSAVGVFAKNTVPDAAVMLQIKQADALLGASATSSPDELSALLEKHTLDMVNTGVAPEYTADGTLENMKGTMTTLIDELKKDITASQTTINNAKNSVVNQYDVVINGPLRTSLNQKKLAAKSQHATCRSGEDTALQEEEDADEAVVNKWTARPRPPCGADKVDQLVGTNMWAAGWGAKLDGLVATAKVKQAKADEYTGCDHEPEDHVCLATRLHNCNDDQRKFEEAWCEQAHGHHTGCDLIDTQKSDYDVARKAFIKHSHMIQSARKVICFLNVIKDGSGQQLNGDKVQKCVDLNYVQDPEETAGAEKITVTYDASDNQAQDSIELLLPDPRKRCTPWNLNRPGTAPWMTDSGFAAMKDSIRERFTKIHSCPGAPVTEEQ